MNALRRFNSFEAHYPAVARLIVAVLPLILAACTNGGSNGTSY
jgi:hypothetical protein